LAKPEVVKKAFGDATNFNAELARYYPKEAQRIHNLKVQLKQHHIDLADLIHDVNVHAKGTMDNLDRVISKLFLRKKYKAKLTPRHDVKIW
jgi:hypothetical protein